MDRLRTLLILFIVSGMSSCILPPGMNSECTWPSERRRPLNLQEPADRRHLVLDAELIEELVDRYRFHPVDEQRRCDDRLVAAVAEMHSVDVSDVARARARIPECVLRVVCSPPSRTTFH